MTLGLLIACYPARHVLPQVNISLWILGFNKTATLHPSGAWAPEARAAYKDKDYNASQYNVMRTIRPKFRQQQNCTVSRLKHSANPMVYYYNISL